MRFTDYMCPICQQIIRYWEPMIGWCSKEACKAQNNVLISLPDKSQVLSPVKMKAVATGSSTSKFTITRDL